MAFLVVSFDDQNISEVTASWLEETDDGSSQCWWPANSKTISSLIAKQSQPDKKTWKLLNIKIEKICQSLEKARKLANDEFYKTTDDEDLGKGRRTQRKRILTSSEEDENDEEVKNTGKRQRTPYSQKQRGILADLPLSPNKCTRPRVSTDPLNSQPLSEDSELRVTPDDVQASKHDHDGDPTSASGVSFSRPKNQEEPDFEAFSDRAAENRLIQENQRIIIRMLATLQVDVQGVSQKLDRRQQPGSSESTEIVKCYRPLQSIAEINEFDKKISEDKDFAIKFTQLVRKVGGHTANEDSIRILKKIFTNPCAQLCSWKGRKKNFCIEDLNLTKIVKEAILEQYPSTKEIDFEATVSEWFRFAKQRTTREAEKQQKIQKQTMNKNDEGKSHSVVKNSS